jgi:hypothetical protein
MHLDGKEYYSLQTAATGTGYKESTLQQYHATGKIPGRKISGELWFTSDDIAAIHKLKESYEPVPEIKPPQPPVPVPIEEKRAGLKRVREILTKPAEKKKKNILIPKAEEKTYDCLKSIAAARGETIGDLLMDLGKEYAKKNKDHLKALRA